MNIHKNARTTPQSRAMLVHRVLIERWPVAEVALSLGVSQRTVYKCWRASAAKVRPAWRIGRRQRDVIRMR